MSFWQSDDKIPILQTKVKIPAENGLNFDQGGVIHLTIPAGSVEFFQPKESYLEFLVNIEDQPTNGRTRLCLDAELGGHVLIRDITIYQNAPGGSIVEQIQNYNTLTAIKYDYESDSTIREKRALTEGCSTYSSYCRSTRQTVKTDLNNVPHNQYWQPYTYGGLQQQGNGADGSKAYLNTYNADITTDALNVKFNPGQQKVKCQLQLNTGIFSSDKVFPTLLTDGLRIEIQLEEGPRALRILDSVNPLRQARNCPIFHSITGLDTADKLDAGAWDTAGKTATIFVKRDNNQIGLENFPLVVGEKVCLIDNTVSLQDVAAGHYYASIVEGQTGPKKNIMTIKEIQWADGDVTNPTTTEGGHYGLVKITLDDTYALSSAKISGDKGSWSLVSQSVSRIVTPNGDSAAGGWNTQNIKYKVEDVNMVLQKLQMPQQYVSSMMRMMKGGGTINYDFLSVTNYKYSQLKSDVVANIRLPLSQSRCRGILSIPTDASIYPGNKQITGFNDLVADGVIDAANGKRTANAHNPDLYSYVELESKANSGSVDAPIGVGGQAVNSIRTGLVGIWDHASQYRWFYNGQLNPGRPVDVSKMGNKTSIEQQAMIELEKALAVCGIKPLSFRKFQSNAVIGRALSLQNGTYDARGKDFNLQIEYSETTSPEKNKLWHNFVHHIRRLEIKGNAVQVIV